MVNLLPGTRSRPSLPALTREQRVRVRTRWSRIAGWPTELRLELERRAHARLEAELEELEQAPALEHALDLLAGLDAIRSELVAADPDPDPETAGGPSDPSEADPATWVVYWPGRSLASGEAEIASRGYLDVWDRPPLGDWLEAVARPTRTGDSLAFEVGILVGVRAVDRARLAAGCAASPSGALEAIEMLGGPLGEQLRAGLLRARDASRS
ncbi:MAG: hypothetical protein H6748_09010 [Spirochaetaceae bacterium]|nr:hypothetical protein [Spirochaetaceae bacterium]